MTSRAESYTGSRPDVAALVAGEPRRLLDVGCSDGSLAASLPGERWGIEIDPAYAAAARQRLDRVLEGDALSCLSGLDERFDLVICADALEHMADPEAVLREVRTLTDQCVVSLPNVRFYTTFTNLALRGRWPQLDRGVHDHTHLRWFTDRDAREMFERAGFRVEAATTNYRLSDSPHSRKNRLARHVARGPLRGFLAYQHLYRLR